MDYGIEALKKLLVETEEISNEEYSELFEFAQKEYKDFFEHIQKIEEVEYFN